MGNRLLKEKKGSCDSVDIHWTPHIFTFCSNQSFRLPLGDSCLQESFKSLFYIYISFYQATQSVLKPIFKHRHKWEEGIFYWGSPDLLHENMGIPTNCQPPPRGLVNRCQLLKNETFFLFLPLLSPSSSYPPSRVFLFLHHFLCFSLFVTFAWFQFWCL